MRQVSLVRWRAAPLQTPGTYLCAPDSGRSPSVRRAHRRPFRSTVAQPPASPPLAAPAPVLRASAPVPPLRAQTPTLPRTFRPSAPTETPAAERTLRAARLGRSPCPRDPTAPATDLRR